MGGTTDEISVTLTWAEVLLASNVGVMRNVQSLKLGRGRIDSPAHQFGGMDYAWATNIEGACGELAVAKYLNRFWSGAIGDIEADDVGPYQVKTNTSRRWDDLIVRTWNKPNRVYISVLSFLPRFVICGWEFGTQVKKAEFLRMGRKDMPAYFYPRARVHDMVSLPSEAEAALLREQDGEQAA